jgi:hypothetical protein
VGEKFAPNAVHRMRDLRHQPAGVLRRATSMVTGLCMKEEASLRISSGRWRRRAGSAASPAGAPDLADIVDEAHVGIRSASSRTRISTWRSTFAARGRAGGRGGDDVSTPRRNASTCGCMPTPP